jgi:hypothetical protein
MEKSFVSLYKTVDAKSMHCYFHWNFAFQCHFHSISRPAVCTISQSIVQRFLRRWYLSFLPNCTELLIVALTKFLAGGNLGAGV